jgi:hypothetical protein
MRKWACERAAVMAIADCRRAVAPGGGPRVCASGCDRQPPCATDRLNTRLAATPVRRSPVHAESESLEDQHRPGKSHAPCKNSPNAPARHTGLGDAGETRGSSPARIAVRGASGAHLRRRAGQAGQQTGRRDLLREHRPDHREPGDDPGQQLHLRPAVGRLHTNYRSRRDRTQRGQEDTDHEGRAGPADQCADGRRRHRPGPLPVAPARRLERPAGGRGRVGHAQRVQRRLRLERLSPR